MLTFPFPQHRYFREKAASRKKWHQRKSGVDINLFHNIAFSSTSLFPQLDFQASMRPKNPAALQGSGLGLWPNIVASTPTPSTDPGKNTKIGLLYLIEIGWVLGVRRGRGGGVRGSHGGSYRV